MINLFLIILLLVLLCPYPIIYTLKKILPEIIILFVIIMGYNLFSYQNNTVITITALNEQNKVAEGNEIWINSVQIDGEMYLPADIFVGNWLDAHGRLGWRNFDNLEPKIMTKVSNGKNIKIFFERNRWRGKASIKIGNSEEYIDCYYDIDNSADDLVYEISNRNYNGFLINKNKILLGIILASLVYLSLGWYKIKNEDILNLNIIEKRCIWIDLLKVISTFMVVLIHASGSIYNNSVIGTSLWYRSIILNSVPRFAVPCFIMVTGILMLSKNYTQKEIYQKKIPRIVIALFFWSIVYILWNDPSDLKKDILAIPFIPQSGVLWYGYQLIWLYILYPVIKRIDISFEMELKRYFLAIILGLVGIWDLVKLLIFPIEVANSLPFASIIPHFSYVALFLLGKYIIDSYSDFSARKNILNGSILSIIGITIMIVTTIYLDKSVNSIRHDLFSECKLPVIIYSTGILRLFLGIKQYLIKIRNLWFKTLIVHISNLSLGIYFLHSLVLWIFPEIKLGKNIYSIYNPSVFQIIICTGINFIITIVLVSIISKIPKIKNIVL